MTNLIMDIFDGCVETYGKVNGRQFKSEYQLLDFQSDSIYFTNLCRKLKKIKNVNLVITSPDYEDLLYVSEFINQANIPHEIPMPF